MTDFIKKVNGLKRYWTETVVLICCIICFISVKYYYDEFSKNGISDKTGDWGVFGDYIGGVLGTILSFFSVILIYATYKNQVIFSTLQQFETTFFNLLQNQREIIKSLKGNVQTEEMPLDPEGEEQISDDYISAVARELFNHFDGRRAKYIDGQTGQEIKNVADDKDENLTIIEKYYGQVYSGKEADLGHYFRHLYHIVKYTNESSVPNKKNISI